MSSLLMEGIRRKVHLSRERYHIGLPNGKQLPICRPPHAFATLAEPRVVMQAPGNGRVDMKPVCMEQDQEWPIQIR